MAGAQGSFKSWGRLTCGLAASLLVCSACGPEEGDPFANALEAVSVCGGAFFACALLPEGEVACWGSNKIYWSLGQGPGTGIKESARPLLVETVPPAAAVWCGHLSVCMMSRDQRMWCWGTMRNAIYDLSFKMSTPQEIDSPQGIVMLAAGAAGDCAVTEAGEVWCWGSLAPPRDEPVTAPWENSTRIEGIEEPIAIGAGWNLACALERSGLIKCWGWRLDLDESPRAHEEAAWEPYVLGHIEEPAGLALSSQTGCVWSASGLAWCFGANWSGQVGDGTLEYRNAPVLVEGLVDVVQVASGGASTCALTRDGTVYCWGANYSGQLGDGEVGDHLSPTPWPVTGLPPARLISTERVRTFAVLESGKVAAWGSNNSGALGAGEEIGYHSPVPVPVLPVDRGDDPGTAE